MALTAINLTYTYDELEVLTPFNLIQFNLLETYVGADHLISIKAIQVERKKNHAALIVAPPPPSPPEKIWA
jgi:hypothetical protein